MRFRFQPEGVVNDVSVYVMAEHIAPPTNEDVSGSKIADS